MEDFKLQFIAVPFLDTDVMLLFTQTYSQYMGLARWNFMFNSEFKSFALKKSWTPVTTAETMTYFKSVKAFNKVDLITNLVHWNEHRFYLKHEFYVKGKLCGRTYVAGLVKSPKGHLKPNEVFKTLGVTVDSPPLPEEIKGWVEGHELSRKKPSSKA